MAHTLNALKRKRQYDKRRMQNRIKKTIIKTGIKKFLRAVESKDKEQAKMLFISIQKNLDKAAKRNIYHKNKVARLKSRYQKLLDSLSK